MNNTITSIIRTGVPYAVGLVISWAATLGLHIPAEADASITAAGTFAVGTAWYVTVRGLEKRWPKLGWLLGVPTQPVYAPVVKTPHVDATVPAPAADAATPAAPAPPEA